MPTHSLLKSNPSLLSLLIIVFVTHLGSYLVLPVLPILLKVETGLHTAQIGFTLAVISVFMQVGSLFGGFLADRTGRRFIIAIGALIRALGLLGFAYFKAYPLILMTAAISGLGLGLNAPSTKAFISTLVKNEMKSTAFSLRGIFANTGMAIAGLVVFAFLTNNSKLIFLIAAGIYVIAAIISWFFLPQGCKNGDCDPIDWREYKEALRNVPFILFVIATMFVWILYVQFALILPLRAEHVLSNGKNISIIWTINSITVILLQTAITKNIIKKVHPFTSVGLGTLCIGLALGSLYFAQSLFYFAFAGLVFIVGEMLIVPTLDTVISQLALARFLGMFFGLASVFTGIGEALGNFLGGRWFGLPHGWENTRTYIAYFVIGIVLFVGMQLLRRLPSLRKIQSPREELETSSPQVDTAVSHPNPINEG